MAGFYIFHNPGIGLRCFAFGLFFGIGGLFATVYNAAVLGAVFGYMATMPHKDNFFHFVTAHGPFELTAIVLFAAAGMRLGFSLVNTRGLGRIDSLRRAGDECLPIACAGIVLFLLGGRHRGLLLAFAAPYWVKAAVAIVSAIMLLFYLLVLGYLGKRPCSWTRTASPSVSGLPGDPRPDAARDPCLCRVAGRCAGRGRGARHAAERLAHWPARSIVDAEIPLPAGYLSAMFLLVLWEAPLATAPVTLCPGAVAVFRAGRIAERSPATSPPRSPSCCSTRCCCGGC